MNPPKQSDPKFLKLNKETTKNKMGLSNHDTFVDKVVSLGELLEVRHCVFLIGITGSSKSEVWKTLFQTFNDTGFETAFDTLNPKAVTCNELFGAFNKAKEWKNGIIAVVMTN